MSEGIILRRLRLQLPSGLRNGEERAWQRHAESALASADMHPPGLPGGSVLVLRRLPDPASGLLWQGRPWQAGMQWGAQVRAAIEARWRSAARPAQGPVPLDAEAVWFADRAEWLACLSLDLAAGLRRWWWEHWQRQGATTSLAALWRSEARWLPPALAIIHARRPQAAARLVARLSPAEAPAVCAALLAAYDLPAQPARYGQLAISREQAAAIIPGQELAALPAHSFHLAALALGLHYAPEAARRRMAAPPPQAQAGSDRAPAIGSPIVSLGDERLPVPEPPAPGPPPAQQSHGKDMPARAEPAAQDIAAAPQPPPPRWAQPSRPAAPVARLSEPPAAASLAAAPLADGADGLLAGEGRSDKATGAASALGGAWYLLNMLIALDWLDEPASPALSPWLRLGAVARRLLGEATPDPLWRLLIELAGLERHPEQAGPALASANDWLARQHARLFGWLAEQLPAFTHDAWKEALLDSPALILHSRTHIDVHFSIDRINLELRVAGLDRDPGWVPRLQRVVSFHFD